MSKYDFEIGTEVHCRDGQCGRLHKVALDPHTQRVTDLIVQRGFLLTTDRVLPVELVEEATREGIRLSIPSRALREYPEYRELEFEEPAPEAQTGHYERNDVRCWRAGYRVACSEPVVPMVRKQAHLNVLPSRAVLERGTPVLNRDEHEIGTVDHLLVDPESGQVSHLVIRRGLLPYYPILPIARVESVTDEAVGVSLNDGEVEMLPRYRRRDSEDIETELRDQLRLANLRVPQVDLDAVAVSVEAGIVHLSGWVSDVRTKRRVEAVARAIEGVVDVQNELDTEMAMTARVQQALLSDPRTELSAIDVTNQPSSVITLKGVVDSVEVKEAAKEIAADQPGVLSVVNELEVKPDEDTPFLNARLLSLVMRREGTS
jgi:osmotically-inducible protein OsmY/sporulation protein YlmC with PRC-barrel domain